MCIQRCPLKIFLSKTVFLLLITLIILGQTKYKNKTLPFKISKFQCLEFSKSWRGRVSPSAVWKLIPMSGSMYIGFASVGPEDRSHFLTSSAWISRKSPWQWFLYVWPKTKVFANGCAGNFTVQCVEMYS